MTIKEVEQELGILRATIRFYEKQGLLHPKRAENAYRDYSDEDLIILKKILIFRKIGLSVTEIKELFDGAAELSESIDKNIESLQKQIQELNGALEICRQIYKRKEELETFDEQFYWEEIHREEKRGFRFMDITSDLLKYEKEDIIETLSVTDSEGNYRYSKKRYILKGISLILACGCIVWLLEDYRVTAFLKGAFTPMLFLLILTIFEIPSFLLKEKQPNIEKQIHKLGYAVATVGIFVYIITFFGPSIRNLVIEAKESIEYLTGVVVGFGITVWGFIYHILERRLIFDRRHVTGVDGFYVVVFGGLISGSMLLSYSKEACISYVIFLIIIYQSIDYFIEEKEYPEEERFKKPGV